MSIRDTNDERRRNTAADALRAAGWVSESELAERLGVSETTVRIDHTKGAGEAQRRRRPRLPEGTVVPGRWWLLDDEAVQAVIEDRTGGDDRAAE